MTTFIYEVKLTDSEMNSLDAAIKHYLSYCEASLVDGPKAPFWAHRSSLESVRKRLLLSATVTSSNTFWETETDQE